jgi:hypothetical protein
MKHVINYFEYLKEENSSEPESFDIEANKEKIKAVDLISGQNEICIDELLENLIGNEKFVKKALKGKIKVKDIIVSSDFHILDGHHKWAAIFTLNPECEIKCTKLNIPFDEAIPILKKLLKDSNIEEEEPKDEIKLNIFDLDKDELKEVITTFLKNADKEQVKFLLDSINKSKESYLHPLNHFISNIYKIPNPKKKAPKREDMLQLDVEELDDII